MNGHTSLFHPRTQILELHNMTQRFSFVSCIDSLVKRTLFSTKEKLFPSVASAYISVHDMNVRHFKVKKRNYPELVLIVS